MWLGSCRWRVAVHVSSSECCGWIGGVRRVLFGAPSGLAACGQANDLVGQLVEIRQCFGRGGVVEVVW